MHVPQITLAHHRHPNAYTRIHTHIHTDATYYKHNLRSVANRTTTTNDVYEDDGTRWASKRATTTRCISSHATHVDGTSQPPHQHPIRQRSQPYAQAQHSESIAQHRHPSSPPTLGTRRVAGTWRNYRIRNSVSSTSLALITPLSIRDALCTRQFSSNTLSAQPPSFDSVRLAEAIGVSSACRFSGAWIRTECEPIMQSLRNRHTRRTHNARRRRRRLSCTPKSTPNELVSIANIACAHFVATLYASRRASEWIHSLGTSEHPASCRKFAHRRVFGHIVAARSQCISVAERVSRHPPSIRFDRTIIRRRGSFFVDVVANGRSLESPLVLLSMPIGFRKPNFEPKHVRQSQSSWVCVRVRFCVFVRRRARELQRACNASALHSMVVCVCVNLSYRCRTTARCVFV